MQTPLVKTTDPTSASKKLTQFTETEFLSPEVVQVTENVYAGIGFALGNSIIVEGKSCILQVFKRQMTTINLLSDETADHPDTFENYPM